jgi:hypothetical protein
MKRIKIMLLSLLVLATVGGVLAFKAKEENFCIYSKKSWPVTTLCPMVSKVESVQLTDYLLTSPIFYIIPRGMACPSSVPSTYCTLRITDVYWDQ